MGRRKKEESKLVPEVGLYDDEPNCKFNMYVGCDTPQACKTCGWNPEVSAKRLKRYGG